MRKKGGKNTLAKSSSTATASVVHYAEVVTTVLVQSIGKEMGLTNHLMSRLDYSKEHADKITESVVEFIEVAGLSTTNEWVHDDDYLDGYYDGRKDQFALIIKTLQQETT